MLTQTISRAFSQVVLKANKNQARELGEYAIEFMKNGNPSVKVLERCKLFHTDSVFCGLSALALKTNAPTILAQEAKSLAAKTGAASKPKLGFAKVFGSNLWVPATNAIVANSAAVREWDSNGTVFGYDASSPARRAGEFGHNDYYPVVIAAAQQNASIDGKTALKAMVLSDEIRGRLAEVFSLKTYKIDHVVHGAIASICTYGALLGATPAQIESAIGMFVAHYIPFRAIRAGHQLSDSKGASAAISTEAAIKCLQRSMNGFVGPADIFRNPEAIFRLFQKTKGDSPFDITLSLGGDDFAVMGMHFKLGLYEHQSAGALEGLQKLILDTKFVQNYSIDSIDKIKVTAYEPAFGIIGDPAKRDPHTRQSADHSMVYILGTMLRKAFTEKSFHQLLSSTNDLNEIWKALFLSPYDYSHAAVRNKDTRKLMALTEFEHGGKEYDDKYPEGIPTRVQILLKDGKNLDSQFVMFPSGHARNANCDLTGILQNKFKQLGKIAIKDSKSQDQFYQQLNSIDTLSNKDLQTIYNCEINYASKSIDE
ncbi:unnamed protein product [Paramecium octaurelia]|uniref:MmgE/PrpD N-terminal domain-containing protein n=1 Tax=Paramecium octaurelia TaxID=43137 RepID=A0A8S1XJY0_PAROT|nr:unnamed protein product [Paramecium octaurelia]